MRVINGSRLALALSAIAVTPYVALASPTSQVPLSAGLSSAHDRQISSKLFAELEELSRIVDISYCVGSTGIQKPFQCASRCQDFDGFDLVTVSACSVLELVSLITTV